MIRRIGAGYVVVSLLLVAFAVAQAVREPWISDFWEHAAVVRELEARPFEPKHPQLGIDAPDAFISPDSYLVAGLAKATGLDPVRALGVAGILNMVLVLVGLRLFAGVLASAHAQRASFYALLFAVFLWGKDPWVYSGFLNWSSLAYVMPYPSTFAAGLAMVTLWMWTAGFSRRISPSIASVVPTAILSAVVLVTHPPAFLFLAAGLVALTFDARRGIPPWIALAAIFALAAGLAALWPYYPLFGLVFGGQAAFYKSNQYMYFFVAQRTLPALAALPFLVLAARKNPRHPILVMLVILAAAYVAGGLTKAWNLGRSIPFLMLLAQIQLAIGLAGAEVRWPRGRQLVPVAAVALCLLLSFWWQVLPSTAAMGRDRNMRSELDFLAGRVGPDDVVMTDLDTGWVVPAFAGKVVASRHPVAFVPDHDARENAVRTFFDPNTGREERESILRRYGTRFVLVDESAKGMPPAEALSTLASPVESRGRYRLLAVLR